MTNSGKRNATQVRFKLVNNNFFRVRTFGADEIRLSVRAKLTTNR